MIRRFLTVKAPLVWLFGAVAAVFLATMAIQASLPNGTPAIPVQRSLWGNLEPVDSPDQPLPSGRDTTSYNEFGRSRYWEVPWWMSIDIENGFIFTIGSQSLQIWDPSGDPENPTLVTTTSRNRIIDFVTGEPATGWPMRDLDLPPGVDRVAAIAGSEMGLTIWDTSNKSNPFNVYQYPAEGHEVYATTIRGRHYAFMAATEGLLAFDMTQALALTTACLDNDNGTACSGVYKGEVGDLRSASYVGGTGKFLVATGGFGLKIYDISQFPLATLELDALSTTPVRGTTLWRDVDSTNLYLAFVTSRFQAGVGTVYEGWIYNVSCLNSANGCSSLGSNPMRMIPLGKNHGSNSFISFSRSGPAGFLYFGTDNRLGGGPQREFLVDVTDPEDPVRTQDITPQGTAVVDGETVDYWSWYYEGNNGPNNLTGFNNVGPRRGKFLGEYFYRAGWSIFDIHRRAGGLPPAVEFDWVSQEPDGNIYSGSQVDFQDLSTGQPNAWSWFFAAGSPTTSTARNPTGITLSSNGPFPDPVSVTLTAFNDVGASDPLTKTLEILDPAPNVASVSSNVQSATVCQPVTFTANDATGRSPLTFSWEVLDSQDLVVHGPITPAENPSELVWQTEPSLLSGNYRARVTVTGEGASDPKISPGVQISSLPNLPATGSFQPTHDDFIAGTVDFHVSVPGATEWKWDFGDGTSTDWLSDPIEGPNPTHEYEEVGTYLVTVQVRNCTNPNSPATSAAHTVVIDSIVELRAEFDAHLGCINFGGLLVCGAAVGDAIPFEDLSSGAETWEYDWDGNGSFEDGPLSQPRTSHTYNTTGQFFPKLRVKRANGSEVSTYTLPKRIDVSNGNNPPPPPPPSNPSITISGPSVGSPGAALTFTATARNCTASPNGWSWTTSGGFVAGGTNSNRISVTWSSTGPKSLTARNTGCGNTVSAPKTVNITDSSEPPPPPSGGPLAASFTVFPANPVVGSPVSFNGSASTGDPDEYRWNFGDGGSTTTAGPQIQHVYQAPGEYDVRLTLAKAGSCNNFGLCFSAEVHKTVVVTGSALPEPEPEEPMTHCEDDPEALCLLDDQFKVKVTFIDPETDEVKVAKPLPNDPLPNQDGTGFLWFFSPNSVDLIVKLVDASSLDGFAWFFAGSLTNVEYTISVEDRATDPPTVKTYENVFGNICGVADTQAFASVDLTGGSSVTGLAAPTHTLGGGGDSGGDPPPAEEEEEGEEGDGGEVTGDTESCQADTETLCLQDGHFEIKVNWRNQHPPFGTGTGHAIQGTPETGYFWFFSPSNVELVVKIIDGHEVNGHDWVFLGSLSDIEYDVAVRNIETGDVKTYTNAAGNICGQADTVAFE